MYYYKKHSRPYHSGFLRIKASTQQHSHHADIDHNKQPDSFFLNDKYFDKK